MELLENDALLHSCAALVSEPTDRCHNRFVRTKAQLTAQEQMARAELEELRTQLATAQAQLAERSRVVSEITAELNALRNAQSELEQRLTEASTPALPSPRCPRLRCVHTQTQTRQTSH